MAKEVKKVTKKTTTKKVVKKAPSKKNIVEILAKDKFEIIREMLNENPNVNVTDKFKELEHERKLKQPIIKKNIENLDIESELIDKTDELYITLDKSLKDIEKQKSSYLLLENQQIKLLAKSVSELDSEEISYILSYVDLFKAKKNFEQLRIKVGDFKV